MSRRPNVLGPGLAVALVASLVASVPAAASTAVARRACPATGMISDPAGDADELVVVDASPAQAPSLDLRRAWISWNRARKVATFHILVTDLRQSPPAGSLGEDFNFYFTWAHKNYAVEADRNIVLGDVFLLDSVDATGLRSPLVDSLPGTFDNARSEVRVELPAAAFAKSSDNAYRAASLATGAQLSTLSVDSRRDDGAVVPEADTAAGRCAATLR